MISHDDALSVIDLLAGDDEALQLLRAYVEAQREPNVWDDETVAQRANRAINRATEARDRVITLAGDVERLRQAMVALRRELLREIADVVSEIVPPRP